MNVDDLGSLGGPRHVHVDLGDGKVARALQTGDIGPDGELVNAAGLERMRLRAAGELASSRANEIQGLAALIRKVDGNHTMGASALAEALIDGGVSFRPCS